ncbi:hypothetical protein T4A_11080 [Trichinella pseudospiralis]|uniref:Secreted protein n=1 Tax=Trichinella pseudospiralis TaxID=6337 RepID=A0A0V1E3C1_TRIPS|nr:hypothetical protein T4A_11080 [Trichinella pseudospiralis]
MKPGSRNQHLLLKWRRPLVRIPLLVDLLVCALLQSVQINVHCASSCPKLTAVQRMEHGKPENVFNTKQSPDSTEQNKKTKKVYVVLHGSEFCISGIRIL